jgi:two-component system phosphate regulon sensor histidine kinase PhoR
MRRQVLLFLLGVLIPGTVLLAFGVMLVRQETELSERRDADALSIRARTLSDSLGAWLDSRYVAAGDSLRAGTDRRYPANDRLLFVGTYVNGAYVDASSRVVRPHPLAQSGYASVTRAVRRQEFADGNRTGAIRSLRRRVEAESDSTRRTDLRVSLARALFATNRSSEAASQARLALQQGPEVQNEFGTPLALYAADILIDNEQFEGICERLSASSLSPKWLTLAAAQYLSELIEKAGCPPHSLLVELLAETVVANGVATLGDRLIADRTSERWIAIDETWLLRKVDGDRREAEPVVAIRLSDLKDRLGKEGASALSVASLASPLETSERTLAPAFPMLRVTFPTAAPPVVSRRTLLGLAITLVLLMTVVGGYLLWRDMRREARLTHLQSQFLASVSHELRTPLTSIRLFSDTMLEYGSDDVEQREKSLRVISHESGRLTRMLNNVLNSTRVERGTMTYQLAPGDLADSAECAIEAMRQAFDHAGVTIDRELSMARGNFDADAMEQAVLNLLSNALKYAADGRRVVVRSWERNGHAALSVQDFGPGIPRAEHQRVFDRFYRLQGETDLRKPGAGLGLALVEHIAVGHGGRVVLDSEPGSGCLFSIYVPLSV